MEKAAKRSGTPEGFRESLKKATTEMLVLFLLRRRPMYTYEMMSEIEALSQGVITFNTLYPDHPPPPGLWLCGGAGEGGQRGQPGPDLLCHHPRRGRSI